MHYVTVYDNCSEKREIVRVHRSKKTALSYCARLQNQLNKKYPNSFPTRILCGYDVYVIESVYDIHQEIPKKGDSLENYKYELVCD